MPAFMSNCLQSWWSWCWCRRWRVWLCRPRRVQSRFFGDKFGEILDELLVATFILCDQVLRGGTVAPTAVQGWRRLKQEIYCECGSLNISFQKQSLQSLCKVIKANYKAKFFWQISSTLAANIQTSVDAIFVLSFDINPKAGRQVSPKSSTV